METIKLWRPAGLTQVELLRAHYHTQTFAPHTHEGLAFGVIENGALGFRYRGQNVVAAAGAINLVYPGEAHTGHALDRVQGWAYRMFYFDAQTLDQVSREAYPRCKTTPFFGVGMIWDPSLARRIARLHRDIEAGLDTAVEYDTRLLDLLVQMIRRHADRQSDLPSLGQESRAIREARAYIEARCTESITLAQLAQVARLSRYHLVRVFQKQVGLPPHKYQMQRRVARAKELIQRGQPLCTVALDCGFADQSHLNKHFKRVLGLTPGQYRNSVQDS